jgi:hypothetical protein
MAARIVIELEPSGEPGKAFIDITSEVSDGGTLTADEIALTLERTLQGIRDGNIVPTGRHRRDLTT